MYSHLAVVLLSSQNFSGTTSSTASLSASRRSCQTCRDKHTERKRYLSKSREAIFEKVSRSNLKKSLSKSRERLCDMRLTISKSRDSLSVHHLSNGVRKTSRDETGSAATAAVGFRSLSRSQEVLSSALGGAMKRVAVNGTVSDISHALSTGFAAGTAAVTSSTDDDDFVLVPGNPELMSHLDMFRMDLQQRTTSCSSEDGIPCPEAAFAAAAAKQRSSNSVSIVHQPLVEEENEEEEETVKQTSSVKSSSIGIQVDMASIQEAAAEEEENRLRRQQQLDVKLAIPCTVRPGNAVQDQDLLERRRSASQPPSLQERTESTSSSNGDSEKGQPFSHSSTMGESERKKKDQAAWRAELAKFQLQKRVSQLIGTFDRSDSREEGDESEAELKQRRGSLQILDDSDSEARNPICQIESSAAKQLRRKSTSALILSGSLQSEMTILGLTNILIESVSSESLSQSTAKKVIVEEEKEEIDGEESLGTQEERKNVTEEEEAGDGIALVSRRRNWDYFEIDDHPKAISDKKLQQLKSKYQRRRTEPAILPEAKKEKGAKAASGKNKASPPTDLIPCPPLPPTPPPPPPPPPPQRCNSVPSNVLQVESGLRGLDLSIDPLTGECLGSDQNTVMQQVMLH
jgi:hypothetical protein